MPTEPDPNFLGDGQIAAAVDRPGSLDALREAVKARVAEGLALYPQGGRTALNYGGVPRSPGVAVDLRGLDRVVDYPSADLTVTVEAGITLGSLRATLRAEGQGLALDPPGADRATLGGIYATNASGPRRFGLGRPRDQIIGVRFVNGDGEVIKGGGRVVKNVAGYDLPKLMTGSMGTLGIIAEMTLKVRPLPEASALARIGLPTLEAASRTLEGLNTSGTRPVAVELMSAGGSGGWSIGLGFEGNAESVAWQVDRIGIEVGRGGLEVFRGLEADPAWSELTEWPAEAAGPLMIEAHLKPSAALDWLGSVDPGRWTVRAHAGNGIVRALWTGGPAIDEVAPEVHRLRAGAAVLGGSLILPRCPTAWKDRLRVWGPPRPDWPMAEKVRLALDPRGVMNPGRFLDTMGGGPTPGSVEVPAR